MTTLPAFELPQSMGAILSSLPAYPGSLLLVGALNLVLARQLPDDVRQRVLGRKLRIHVRDARLTFDFSWNGRCFAACPKQQATDLTLSATVHDFVRLAQRLEDPDTLFFSRRLSIEGDTELGLVIKNALDALELPVFDPRQWTPPQVLARLGMWGRSMAAARHPDNRP
ncbi:ubiquinone anaerobic biosynthesis accessory factor UbiT [Polaromonas glacialis]|uniref:ubiquinone anaerobic biosynthesis accessory factor UbiT n=1 Tax=Polaromonas glacialis TaxID=866564 RepID=UPI00068D8440|nr:SCP2 sterol-binding domain-containing protein [Polaromonas glacialis]